MTEHGRLSIGLKTMIQRTHRNPSWPLLEKNPGIRKSSKNHLEKKLLNSQSDHGQAFLATALTWSCLPDAFQTRPPYHHRASSPRLTTTLPPRPCPTRLGILQHFTQVLSSIKSIAYRHAKNRLTMPPIRV